VRASDKWYVQVTGKATVRFARRGSVLLVPVRITVNQHTDTLSGLMQRRKFFHMGMLDNLVGEVERELRPLDTLLNLATPDALSLTGSEVRSASDDIKSFCESARDVCAKVTKKHKDTPVLDFNEDATFSRLVNEGVAMKAKALQSKQKFKSVLLAKYFFELAYLSASGLEACVHLVGIDLFSGASVMDQKGKTPLLVACETANFAICETLVKNSADLSVKDGLGQTALMAACEVGSFEICEMLCNAGADVEVVRHDGATALALSVLSSNWKCVELCLQRLSTARASNHSAPFVVASDLWQLASLYLQSFIIHAKLLDVASRRALVGEIGAFLLAIETKTHHSIKAEHSAPLTMQLGRVRAFIDHHCYIIDNNFNTLRKYPMVVAHMFMQLAAQEVSIVFEGDYAKMPAPRGAYQPPTIECLNKSRTSRHCQWTLQVEDEKNAVEFDPEDDRVKVLVYSPDGAKLARAQGVMVVVCNAVSGFELCRSWGHSKFNRECICQHGKEPLDYKAKKKCTATGHSYWYLFVYILQLCLCGSVY